MFVPVIGIQYRTTSNNNMHNTGYNSLQHKYPYLCKTNKKESRASNRHHYETETVQERNPTLLSVTRRNIQRLILSKLVINSKLL